MDDPWSDWYSEDIEEGLYSLLTDPDMDFQPGLDFAFPPGNSPAPTPCLQGFTELPPELLVPYDVPGLPEAPIGPSGSAALAQKPGPDLLSFALPDAAPAARQDAGSLSLLLPGAAADAAPVVMQDAGSPPLLLPQAAAAMQQPSGSAPPPMPQFGSVPLSTQQAASLPASLSQFGSAPLPMQQAASLPTPLSQFGSAPLPMEQAASLPTPLPQFGSAPLLQQSDFSPYSLQQSGAESLQLPQAMAAMQQFAAGPMPFQLAGATHMGVYSSSLQQPPTQPVPSPWTTLLQHAASAPPALQLGSSPAMLMQPGASAQVPGNPAMHAPPGQGPMAYPGFTPPAAATAAAAAAAAGYAPQQTGAFPGSHHVALPAHYPPAAAPSAALPTIASPRQLVTPGITPGHSSGSSGALGAAGRGSGSGHMGAAAGGESDGEEPRERGGGKGATSKAAPSSKRNLKLTDRQSGKLRCVEMVVGQLREEIEQLQLENDRLRSANQAVEQQLQMSQGGPMTEQLPLLPEPQGTTAGLGPGDGRDQGVECWPSQQEVKDARAMPVEQHAALLRAMVGQLRWELGQLEGGPGGSQARWEAAAAAVLTLVPHWYLLPVVLPPSTASDLLGADLEALAEQQPQQAQGQQQAQQGHTAQHAHHDKTARAAADVRAAAAALEVWPKQREQLAHLWREHEERLQRLQHNKQELLRSIKHSLRQLEDPSQLDLAHPAGRAAFHGMDSLRALLREEVRDAAKLLSGTHKVLAASQLASFFLACWPRYPHVAAVAEALGVAAGHCQHHD